MADRSDATGALAKFCHRFKIAAAEAIRARRE